MLKKNYHNFLLLCISIMIRQLWKARKQKKKEKKLNTITEEFYSVESIQAAKCLYTSRETLSACAQGTMHISFSQSILILFFSKMASCYTTARAMCPLPEKKTARKNYTRIVRCMSFLHIFFSNYIFSNKSSIFFFLECVFAAWLGSKKQSEKRWKSDTCAEEWTQQKRRHLPTRALLN